MIVIIDYGLGNLGSMFNMLKKIGADAMISSTISDIEKADKIILPGVGAFDNGMANLIERGFLPVLNEKVLREKVPLLGVCLGLQLFTQRSEEGKLPGLGWIDGETIRFRFNSSQHHLKVPHMGWNTIGVLHENDLFNDMNEDWRFYFVHSYHLKCYDDCDILAQTCYGYDFPSAVRRDNIMGTQFHPEKSHKYGLKVLKNFVEKV